MTFRRIGRTGLKIALGCTMIPAAMGTTTTADDARPYTLDRPPVGSKNAHYISNREPLKRNALVKLPIGSIEPRGWLRAQLELSADGLVGHLPELSKFAQFDGNAWVAPDGRGHHGWEEVPYWLKGYGDLGYVLGDRRITAEAKKWIEGVLANQREDGYFGSRKNIEDKKPNETGPVVKEKLDLWPNMIMLNVLQSYHEATGDRRVLEFMSRYFRWQLNIPDDDILPGYWDKMRGGDNLESIFWLYNRTGEAWLLEAAERVHDCTAKWSDGVVNWHGVNVCQGFRQPAIWYLQSHDLKHYDAVETNYQIAWGKYGQAPGGMFGADENAREGYTDPRQAAETCSIVEFMHSAQMLATIGGEVTWLDRCEDVAFNSFPPSQTPDLKALHYLTAPNQPQLDRASKSPGIQNEGDMFSYDPRSYRCCQHNVSHGWPYYAEHLWMATHDNGLAAVLYAASRVEAKVGEEGTEVTIDQTTAYPFSDRVSLKLSTPKPVKFPLMLRIPGWAEGAQVSVNGKRQDVAIEPGKYLVIDRTWNDGDAVELVLPMRVTVKRWTGNKHAVSVHRGPLAYSLKIEERWQPYWAQGRWTASEVFPASPWNYGLVLDASADPSREFEVSQKPGKLADNPFTPQTVPVEIRARGRRVPDWTLDSTGLVEPLPPSPVESDEPVETITLIPMGAARLRISAFPTIEAR